MIGNRWYAHISGRCKIEAGRCVILSHCPKRVQAGLGQAHQQLQPGRYALRWSRPHPAELRADAAPSRVLAPDADHRCPARLIFYSAFVDGKLDAPKSLLSEVHRLYLDPKYPEFSPRTMWSLSNAFTSAFKKLDPVPQFKATAKLGEFLSQVPA